MDNMIVTDRFVNILNKRINKASYIAFCLIIFDASISGYGHWLMIGPLSLRMILLIFSFATAVPMMMRNLKAWLKNPMVISFILFVVYFFFSAYRGWVSGNRVDVLINDIRAYAWIALIPVAMVVLDSSQRLLFLVKGLIVFSLLHAFLMVGTNIFLSLSPQSISIIHPFFERYYLCSISVITDSFYRFSCGSSLYMVVGIIFLVYFQIFGRSDRWVLSTIATCMGLISLFFSYTRSYFGGAFIAIFLFLILLILNFPLERKKILLYIIIVFFLTLLMILGLQIYFEEPYLEFALQRTFPNLELIQDPEILDYLALSNYSDGTIRVNTISDLKSMLEGHMILGNGLGAAVTTRESGKVEYFYLDSVNKYGVIGMFFFLFPVFYMVRLLVSSKNKHWVLLLGLFCGLTAFFTTSFFNPIMNSSLGICFYSICIGVFYNFYANVNNCADVTDPLIPQVSEY